MLLKACFPEEIKDELYTSIEAAYVRAFTKMAIDQFITAVLPQHSRSMLDRYLEAEEEELAKYTITTSKDLQIIKETAKSNVEAIFQKPEHIGLVRLEYQ